MTKSYLFPVNLVRDAARIVDSSGVVDKLAAWMKADQKHRGGRTATLSTRAVLIAWVATALAKEPLHQTRVAEVLSVRLSRPTAAIMGVDFTEYAALEYNDVLQRVDRATSKFMEALDYKPLGNRHRIITAAEWQAILADRDQRSKELERKRIRHFRFCNDLLHAQYMSLPKSIRTAAISVTIDATFLAAFGRGASKDSLAAREGDDLYISEPDAGRYARTYKKDGATQYKKSGWGWEYELVALISNDPTLPRAVPHIVLGFNQHPAAFDINARAEEIFDDLYDRGFTLDHVVGDQAYFPGAKPEMLQNKLRRRGAKLVMKYAKPQEDREAKGEGTIQNNVHGAQQIEGRWYCPAMPLQLRSAVVDYQKAVKADRDNPKLTKAQRAERKVQHAQLRDARIAQRTVWEMRRDGKPKENGDYQMMCPASGPGRTVNCPLKPNQPPVARKGAALLEVQSPPKAPGKACTNRKSVKFNQDDDGKYGQYYRYKTEMWRRAHSYGRQVIESFNKSLKHADNILHSSGTRPKRGEAQQAFLALLGTIATNEARINLWMEEHYTEDLKAPDAVTRSGRTKRSNPPRPASRRGKGVSAARAAQLGLPARGSRRR